MVVEDLRTTAITGFGPALYGGLGDVGDGGFCDGFRRRAYSDGVGPALAVLDNIDAIQRGDIAGQGRKAGNLLHIADMAGAGAFVNKRGFIASWRAGGPTAIGAPGEGTRPYPSAMCRPAAPRSRRRRPRIAIFRMHLLE